MTLADDMRRTLSETFAASPPNSTRRKGTGTSSAITSPYSSSRTPSNSQTLSTLLSPSRITRFHKVNQL